MRRWGAVLMLLGANLIAASLAMAYYLAFVGCAMGAADGKCQQGAGTAFLALMGSRRGIVFWTGVAVGVLLFWQGCRMRRQG